MIILHASVSPHDFLLWGESKTGTDPPVPPRGQKPTAAPAAPYPFDAGLFGLRSALRKTAASLRPTKAKARAWTAWLPTRGKQPIASSPLIAEPPRSKARTRIKPWAVTVHPLTAAEAIDLLALAAGRATLAPGVIVGPDLAVWSEALRFAGALVARQQFLPGLEKRDGSASPRGDTYVSRWQPVFAGEDAAHLERLARRLPAVARALAEPGEDAPELPAVRVLKSFVAVLVDHFVRGAATSDPPRPSRRGKKKHDSVPLGGSKGGKDSVPLGGFKGGRDSVHDAWFHALRSDDPVIAGDAGELAGLLHQAETWRRPVELAAGAPFRLGFRLEEPAAKDASRRRRKEIWQVRYLLQPHEDPSLLVPVGELWRGGSEGRQCPLGGIQGGGRQGPLEDRQLFGPRAREATLSSLGQAASISPDVAASLETAEPSGYELDTAGAHDFLSNKAALLEQAGFGVLLPAWWTRRGTKLRFGARAHVKSPKMQGGGGLSLNDVVRFDWELALDGKKLSARELEALARLKTPLVRIRGQWVEVDAAEIRSALEHWRQKGSSEASVRDVVRMALGGGSAGKLEIEGVRASGWISKLLEQLDDPAALEELAAPPAFSGTLRPYQLRGYSWLAFLRRWGLGACLADDMGLGKTVQTLALVQHEWQHTKKGAGKPVLLICPTSVINGWQKEAARFTPELPVVVHHGNGRKKKDDFRRQAQANALVVSSYGLLHRDAESLRRVRWAGVVLDEAQNIKNPETLQARAARSLDAEYRIALTGTPVENNVGDLWSIMEFLNAGFLGTQAHFKRAFFIPIQAEQDPDAARRLRRLTGPFILRRLKTDKSIITDLPEKHEMKVFCALTKEQASLYRAVVKEVDAALEGAEGIERRGLVLATLSKLKQVCNHPAQFLGDNSRIPGRSGKLARLTEMLEELLAAGDTTLVFTQFTEMGGLLKRHLEETFGREVLFLHGGVARAKRDRMVDRFQVADGPRIFLLSLKAGGTGLNLTRANHVFHFDRWWNPAVEDQATDRAFRIGQKRHVEVHKFLCAGTVEEKIDGMIERKKAVARDVVGTGEAWLTELSNAELRDVFRLRREAVKE